MDEKLSDRLLKAADEIEQADSTMPGYVELFRTAAKELAAHQALIKYVEFEVVSKCCPVCGGNQHHDSACVLAAFIDPEKAESYKRNTHDTHINEMMWKVRNDKDFAYLLPRVQS